MSRVILILSISALLAIATPIYNFDAHTMMRCFIPQCSSSHCNPIYHLDAYTVRRGFIIFSKTPLISAPFVDVMNSIERRSRWCHEFSSADLRESRLRWHRECNAESQYDGAS
jgi:hypothetical protein